MSALEASYTADDIQALEGLEHVRLRPGMYIGSVGSSGLHHLLWEVVDNSVDEHLGGVGDRIEITLLADGGARVRDWGRGIPVDRMGSGPHKGRSALEVILTVLNAGGKFGGEKSAYASPSGGLHGVGMKAVTALSSRLVARVFRDGQIHQQSFRLRGDKPGVPDGPLEVVGKCRVADRGTEITFWPDLNCFTDDTGAHVTGFSRRTISERLENRSYVHGGLTFVLIDQRPGQDPTPHVFHSENGLTDLVGKLAQSRDPLCPPIRVRGARTDEQMLVDAAIAWGSGYAETLVGYSNGVVNPNGGRHVEGMTKAITRAVNRYARDRGVLKDKDDNPTGADVRQGLVAVVSLMLPDPSYDSQSKNRLETVSAAGAVESVVYEALTKWLEENPGPAKKIAEKATAAMRERKKSDEDRAADKSLARKSPLKGSGLPDKLYDCQLSPNAALTAGHRTELILVEGDSAGGTAVDARDPRFQAILPLRGKVLNVESASGPKIVANAALATLIKAIGAGRGADFDLDRMRYHDVVLLADADVDGEHITVLLITFFWRQMPDLVRGGRLLVAQPPLYATNTADGKLYLPNDAAKAAFLAEHPNHKAPWNRLKGLGEMDAADLTTVLNPATRRVLQVTVEDAISLDDTLSRLMGDSARERLDWLLDSSLQDTNMGAR